VLQSFYKSLTQPLNIFGLIRRNLRYIMTMFQLYTLDKQR
jgi:hypothetical protein